MKKITGILILVLMAGIMGACSGEAVKDPESARKEVTTTEEPENQVPESSEEASAYEATFEELEALLGTPDLETADLLGGGEENWAEDKSFYIGRIYQIQFYGAPYPVFTSCDENEIVNSVSVWLADGECALSQEEVEQWVQRLTGYTGTDPIYDEVSSEAGTRKWKWVSEERIISLMWTGDLLSIYMNPAIGELE